METLLKNREHLIDHIKGLTKDIIGINNTLIPVLALFNVGDLVYIENAGQVDTLWEVLHRYTVDDMAVNVDVGYMGRQVMPHGDVGPFSVINGESMHIFCTADPKSSASSSCFSDNDVKGLMAKRHEKLLKVSELKEPLAEIETSMISMLSTFHEGDRVKDIFGTNWKITGGKFTGSVMHPFQVATYGINLDWKDDIQVEQKLECDLTLVKKARNTPRN